MLQPLQHKRFFVIIKDQSPLTSRAKALLAISFCLFLLMSLFISNTVIGEQGLRTNLTARNLSPSGDYWLGTDWLGRDMLTRTIKGLCISFNIGLISAALSTVIAGILGTIAATFGKKTDMILTGIIDLFMSMPHLVLLILISFVLGGGTEGVVLAVAVTHWPRLCRVIRAEILQLKNSDYIQLSSKFGKSYRWIIVNHMAPHLFSQFLIGLILMFPHAILHSAGLTFLGFGLSPHMPSIGILLSESMRQLSTGNWWLAIFPGIGLITLVKTFENLGLNLKKILDPKTKQE